MIWKILTAVLAIIVIIMAAVLLKIRAQLRDINDQLDFLYENDTNMLIGTDTNLIYLGQFKQRVNRFVEQWHKKRAEAAKKEQMISDTYTNLSHDIRTPLTSLDGYFQLLKDEKDEKLQAHYIGIIQERIASLKDILEELLCSQSSKTIHLIWKWINAVSAGCSNRRCFPIMMNGKCVGLSRL